MRWFNFSILTLLLLVLQRATGHLLGIGPQNIMPDLLLLFAIILAFRGKGPNVWIACWVLGLARDLTSDARLGSYALCFGLIGMGLVYVKELLYADSPLSIIVLAWVSVMAVEQSVFLIALLAGHASRQAYGRVTLLMFFSALFTAALSPYAQWLILKLRHWLGIPMRESYP